MSTLGINRAAHDNHRVRGQILVIAAIAMLAIVGGVAIVIDGGNAYANQRSTQNGTDAAAESGATVIAKYLSKNLAGQTDTDVKNAVTTTATKNGVETISGYYTNWQGKPIDSTGTITTPAHAISVGSAANNLIPPGAQGVRVFGKHTFGTYFAGAVGFSNFTVNVVATAVAGRLTGGVFLPVVFPVSIMDCSQNGNLNAGVNESSWHVSQPGDPPNGQEYIVPLCKTGGGQFMILDLDPNMNCQQEVLNPPAVQWNLPTWVPADQGNDCAKKIADAMPQWHGKVVTVPICASSQSQPCSQMGSGANAEYFITKVAAFYVDYMSYSNNKTNSLCQAHDNLVTIAGNGSDSCIAGWFVRYVTVGPINGDPVGNTDSVGVQLIE